MRSTRPQHAYLVTDLSTRRGHSDHISLALITRSALEHPAFDCDLSLSRYHALMKTDNLDILLIGGGKMGGAMLAAWRELGVASIAIVDPAPDARALIAPGVTVYSGVGDLPPEFRPSVIVVAVKPQVAASALPPCRELAAGTLVISVMAGQTLANLATLLGPSARMVRAMPNTPAAIRQGITVAVQGTDIGQESRALASVLLESIGEVAWIEDEAQIDSVTAVSGSGPAYVFLLAEALEQAALAEGLSPDLARRLARATVSGAGNLLRASAESATQLRLNVTSPGGTTAAALAVLMPELGSLMTRAVAAAAARSRALSAPTK